MAVAAVAVVFVAVNPGRCLPPWWSWPVGSAVAQEMARQRIPGLSVAVVVENRLRWSTGYGLADVENAVPARANTVYQIASITKPITAVAVLQLAERGALDLDAPIQRYVPSFPEKPWPITPRLLLAHLGGVRNYEGDEVDNLKRFDNVLASLEAFQNDPLKFEPRTKHFYSSYGYNLLGAVIEGASRQSYLGYLSDHIFRPAGMSHTQVADSDAIIPHRAQGYRLTRSRGLIHSRPVDLSNRIPSAGLCSTVDDLARFAIAVQSSVLVRPETIRAMATRQKTSDGRPFDYGLGWSLSTQEHTAEVWHMGRQQRVSTLLYLLPERRFAVALMANLEHAELLPLARRIAALASSAP